MNRNTVQRKSWVGVKRQTSFELPSNDIEGWLLNLTSASNQSGPGVAMETQASAGHPGTNLTLDRSVTQDKRKRCDMPVVRKLDRAQSVTIADKLKTAMDRQDVLDDLVKDFYATSSQAPRMSQLKTWEKYHKTWFGDQSEVWPLTEQSLIRVSALFKLGGYI